MKKIVSFILVLFACNIVLAQNPSSNKIDTAGLDLKAFAEKIVSGAPTDFGKANTLLNWLSSSFTWTYTDYVQRSVKDIIARMGGNCFELATVYMALVNELGIKYRPIAEINLQIPSLFLVISIMITGGLKCMTSRRMTGFPSIRQ
jgi:transglutaminase-like putative cysteine protease